MLENFQFYIYFVLIAALLLAVLQIGGTYLKKTFLIIISIGLLYCISTATLVNSLLYFTLAYSSFLYRSHKLLISMLKFALIALTVYIFVYASSFTLLGDIVVAFGTTYSLLRAIWLVNYIQKGKISSSSFIDTLLYFFYFPSFTIGPIEKPDIFVGNQIVQTIPSAVRGIARLSLGIVFLITVQPFIVTVESSSFFPIIVQPVLNLASLFFNFSGYTHVAIGSSLLLGVKLTENFNAPWLAEDLSDFWKRWHISLMNFANENIFFPFFKFFKGDQQKSIFSTFFLLGIWHGLSPGFLLWGVCHGLALPLSVQLRKRFDKVSAFPLFLKTALKRLFVVYFVSIIWYFALAIS